jgi:predicted enzyme related to lactoylglutathione lyase
MNHSAGSFCFAELHTPELERAAQFYCDLFGWTVCRVSDTYWMFVAGAANVVGMRRSSQHRWLPCVRVGTMAAILAHANGQGLVAMGPPLRTPGVADVTVLCDREGAVLGLWQADGVEGTSLDDGPGSLWWVELATADMQAARSRYASIFGWRLDHTTKFDNGPHGYTLFKVGDRSVAGAFQFEPEWGIEAAWQVYFEVRDFDATAARACALGGEQGFSRHVPNAGRVGVLLDPGDGLFCIARPLPPAPAAT